MTKCSHDWDRAKLLCRHCGALGKYTAEKSSKVIAIRCSCKAVAKMRAAPGVFLCESCSAT